MVRHNGITTVVCDVKVMVRDTTRCH